MLTATQEGNYLGTESFGAFPFQGVVLAHSNEAEWTQFRNNKNNEAFLDRICVIKVPYCLRATEEAKIYDKLLRAEVDLRFAGSRRTQRPVERSVHSHRDRGEEKVGRLDATGKHVVRRCVRPPATY